MEKQINCSIIFILPKIKQCAWNRERVNVGAMFFYFEVLIFEEYFTFKKLFADFTKYLRGKKIKDC